MRVLIAAVLATSLAEAGAARAGDTLAQPSDAWGLTWTTTATVGAWAFMGPMTDGGNGYRDCAAGGLCRAAVSVPTGLSIWNLEIDACDTSSTEEAVAQLWACGPAPGPGACGIVAEVRSGLAATAGCTRFRADVAPQVLVNSYNFTYFADVFGTDGNAAVPVHFRGVRIAMLRQLSAPPPTPTFGDVPVSHPYYRYIEALAAAGISAGCGNGQFCPERSLTRAEMAVILSVALGLNFPD
jgi:hypothetical protein